jgi:hypothetical protein
LRKVNIHAIALLLRYLTRTRNRFVYDNVVLVFLPRWIEICAADATSNYIVADSANDRVMNCVWFFEGMWNELRVVLAAADLSKQRDSRSRRREGIGDSKARVMEAHADLSRPD